MRGIVDTSARILTVSTAIAQVELQVARAVTPGPNCDRFDRQTPLSLFDCPNCRVFIRTAKVIASDCFQDTAIGGDYEPNYYQRYFL